MVCNIRLPPYSLLHHSSCLPCHLESVTPTSILFLAWTWHLDLKISYLDPKFLPLGHLWSQWRAFSLQLKFCRIQPNLGWLIGAILLPPTEGFQQIQCTTAGTSSNFQLSSNFSVQEPCEWSNEPMVTESHLPLHQKSLLLSMFYWQSKAMLSSCLSFNKIQQQIFIENLQCVTLSH